jgi:hypothetical protein
MYIKLIKNKKIHYLKRFGLQVKHLLELISQELHSLGQHIKT